MPDANDQLQQMLLMQLLQPPPQSLTEQWNGGSALNQGINQFGGSLMGAMGAMGAQQNANANRVQDYNMQANQLQAQLALEQMRQQGKLNQISALAPMMGGGGSPGNITSNIGSGVSWTRGGQQANSGPQAYQYGSAPPGSPQSYQPQGSGGSSGYQSASYSPQQPQAQPGGGAGQQPSGYLPSPSVNPTGTSPMRDPNQAAYGYGQNTGPYGDPSRYNRYRDEPPFVGGMNALGQPLNAADRAFMTRANNARGYSL